MERADPRLPFLDTAWSAPRMAEFFGRHVLPALHPGREVAEISIQTATYTPGSECVVLYALRLAASRDPPVRALVTFAKDDRLQDVYDRHYGRNGAPSSSALSLPAYRCLVESFPSDWRLPSLAQAAEPAQAALVLARAGLDGGVSPSHVDVTVLRYSPKRRSVLLYGTESEGGNARRETIAKVYRETARAEAVLRKQGSLREQGAAHGLTIPKPLAAVDRPSVLVMEWLPGVPMKELVTAAPEAVEEATRDGVTVLATLHRLHIEGAEVRSLQMLVERLRKRTGQLQLVVPSLASEMDALLNRIESAGRTLGAETPCVVHGDFSPSQLLIGDGSVALLDLDRACLGDPALDVGNFMAQFNKEAVFTGHSDLRRLPSFVLAEYLRRAPGNGLAERARVYQSLALVRMAIRRFRLAPYSYFRDGRSSTSRLLAEAARCLR